MNQPQAVSPGLAVAPVVITITVDASEDTAFRVFTDGLDTWWPASHHIGEQEDFTGILEPHVGGRWFERGADGSECDWGRVIAWDPPGRLVLDWQLSTDWAFDSSLHTRVEVRFVPLSDTRTRVELVHGGLDAYGEQAAAMRATFDSPNGWRGIIESFAETAGATA